jgi:hypothetical protein
MVRLKKKRALDSLQDTLISNQLNLRCIVYIQGRDDGIPTGYWSLVSISRHFYVIEYRV